MWMTSKRIVLPVAYKLGLLRCKAGSVSCLLTGCGSRGVPPDPSPEQGEERRQGEGRREGEGGRKGEGRREGKECEGGVHRGHERPEDTVDDKV